MSKHAYEKDTPCGRRRVEYEREWFLGDTTHDLFVFDKVTSKKLVKFRDIEVKIREHQAELENTTKAIKDLEITRFGK